MWALLFAVAFLVFIFVKVSKDNGSKEEKSGKSESAKYKPPRPKGSLTVQGFETKNYEKLSNYLDRIKPLSRCVNDSYSELDYKLQCAEEAMTYYAELKLFCSQSESGTQWFQSTCSFQEAEAYRAASCFREALSTLEKRRAELAQGFQKGGWRTYWDDQIHTLAGQGARITRSYEEAITVEAYNPATYLALIRGASGKRYLTTFQECTCPDYKKRELPCKHIYCLCRLAADPDFSAPLKIPKWGLYGIGACVTGTFNFGTQEDVRTLLEQYHATVSLSIAPTDFILEGQKSVTPRAIQRATRLKLMQINEEDLLSMLDTDSDACRTKEALPSTSPGSSF